MNKNLKNTQYHIQKVIEELAKSQIVYKEKALNPITALNQTYRTGTAVRIDKFNLNLPKQSLYDHLVSLACISDIMIETLEIKVNILELANLCIFHDLSEIIIGDVPDFTTKSLAGKHYKTKNVKIRFEHEANKIIAQQLPKELSEYFDKSINLLKNDIDSEIYLFFNMVDKIEPILSMWRYINIYGDKVDKDVFLEAMSDFFINPKVKKHAINHELEQLIIFLQNKNNAREYFKNGDTVFDDLNSEKFKACVIQLIAPREIL